MIVKRRRHPPLLVFMATFVLTIVLTFFAAGDNTLPGDVELLDAMHELENPVADSIDQLGYWIGSLPGVTGVAIILAVIGFVTGRMVEGLLVLIAALFRNLNPVLKWIIESPRPTPEAVRVTENATNYGFPSGHVMGVVLLYGCVLYVAQVTLANRQARLAVQSLCVLAILVTSFSRLYSGAHWPTDVLGGYLWGSLILMTIVSVYNYVIDRRRRERYARNPASNTGSANRQL